MTDNAAKFHGALIRYRIMAWVTGVVLATMAIAWLLLKVIFKESYETFHGPYSIGWIAHGWLFIVYVATALDISFRLRLSVGRTLLVALAGTIPFMSFVADHFVVKKVRAASGQ